MDINVGQLLTHRAHGFSQTEAIVDHEQRLSFEKLNQQVNQVSHWLKEQTIKPGDRVAILCKNSIAMVSIWLATMKIGAIAQPINTRLNLEEMKTILDDGKPRILFYDAQFSELTHKLQNIGSIKTQVQIGKADSAHLQFSDICHGQPQEDVEMAVGGDDPCLLIYTSGTTGKPKGVTLSHNNLWMAGYNISNHFDYRSFDRNLIITPLFHISGYMFSLANLIRGATTIFADFHPKSIWDVIEKEQITQFLAVPTMLKLMMNESDWLDKDIDHLRYIICGADTVPPQLIQLCNSYGIDICHGYGCTEFSGTTSSWTKGMNIEKKHTVGKPFPFTQVKIVHPETGQELPRGYVGEIAYQGPQCFQGYWNNEEETKKVLKQGWYHSGDLGKLDEDGYLIIVDRYKDMIISGGENIYPAEIEGVLLNLDGVQEVSVVGAPDELLGQVPVAFIIKHPHSSLTKQDITEFCRGRLASFKCGEYIEFVDEFPRNTNRKILKTELRAQATQLIQKNKDDADKE